MEISLRADVGQLQGQDTERRQCTEPEMTFDDFLDSFDRNLAELEEIDRNLPFTDD